MFSDFNPHDFPPFPCNIDARGKASAPALGALCALAALGVLLAIILGWLINPWWWALFAASAGFSALGFYEGRKGWCVVRAMGIRTPV